MSWLEQQVRQAKLLESLLCGLVIAGIIGFGVYKLPYLRNVHLGPYTVPIGELTAAKSADELARYWVRVTPSLLLDAGVDHITVRRRRGIETGRSVSGHFWVAQVGDRLMFVESHGARPAAGELLTGFLVDTPQDISDRLMKGVNARWKDKVLPFMLDLGPFETEANIGVVSGGVIILTALVWAVVALRRAAQPRAHASLRALEAAAIPLEEAGAAIQRDIRAGQTMPIGDYRLTRDFLVRTGLKFDVRALKDLLWAYPIVVSHKLYYVIPTGKSHQVALCFSDKQLTLKVGKPLAEKVIPALASVAPWALLGHSPEIAQAWAKQRPQLVALVAERRAQVLAQAASQAQPTQGTA